MQISLTGNPFVDTGLFVLSFLAGKDDPNQLLLQDVLTVHGDGSRLAQINARLKSFTMVFGTNGPLTQSGYRPVGKKKQLSEKNIKAYANVLGAFLNAAQSEDQQQPICEICGFNHSFDFDSSVRQALTKANVIDRGDKQIGREWFPLAGSPGNDAQTLPSASRGLTICPLCLFAVHYVPQALMLMQGKLVCFQSNVPEIAAELTESIASEYQSQLDATQDKIEMIGRKEGTASMTRRLLKWMSLRQQSVRNSDLGELVSLQVWMFTNAGADADCVIIQIPNEALQFLWQARKQGLEKELLDLLKREPKIADMQMLNCISEGRDYSSLYPFKSLSGASPKLFSLYQQVVLGVRFTALQQAQRLATARLATTKPKEQKTLQKAGFLNGSAGKEERKRFRKMMLDLGKTGDVSLDNYTSLFPITGHHPIRTDFRGWKTIGYYLTQPNGDTPDFTNLSSAKRGDMKETHPKIRQAARLYFDDYLKRRGIDHFEKHILDGFQKTHSNPVNWLKEMFIRLHKSYPDFSYGDWDDFVLDEEGKPQTYELVFQMRLELANLFREHGKPTQLIQEKK